MLNQQVRPGSSNHAPLLFKEQTRFHGQVNAATLSAFSPERWRQHPLRRSPGRPPLPAPDPLTEESEIGNSGIAAIRRFRACQRLFASQQSLTVAPAARIQNISWLGIHWRQPKRAPAVGCSQGLFPLQIEHWISCSDCRIQRPQPPAIAA